MPWGGIIDFSTRTDKLKLASKLHDTNCDIVPFSVNVYGCFLSSVVSVLVKILKIIIGFWEELFPFFFICVVYLGQLEQGAQWSHRERENNNKDFNRNNTKQI